jgi:hypothetical protein
VDDLVTPRIEWAGGEGWGEGASEKERAIHAANQEMAVAAASIEALDLEMQRRGAVAHNIPAEMQCPISSDIMRDPVMCTDGHTYERVAITEWVKHKATSPLTNQPLERPVMLIPNYALRGLIMSFVESRGGWAAFT